jgi:NitT/TauT family transport system substrate-binding protein
MIVCNGRSRAPLAIGLLMILAGAPARAEKTQLGISTQLGINYLPMLVIKHERLIEKQAEAPEQDRIAVPAAKVGLQATLLQMQRAKLFGEANYSKLDHLTFSMAHPDALAALLAGSRGSITAHVGQSQFHDPELRSPKSSHRSDEPRRS